MKNLASFKNSLSSPQRIVILTHFKPDADALGSSLGLYLYLKKKGHEVVVITPSDYPDFLHWMAGNDQVIIFEKNRPQSTLELVNQANMIFCLDFSSLSRIDALGAAVKTAKAKKVLIDHHLEPEDFAEFVHWDETAASTAELVYELIVELEDQELINFDIANNLYAGIMTDTGGFRHSNTGHKQFQIAGNLVALGADPSRVSKLIYDTNSVERLRLMGYVLSNKLQVLPEFRTAYIVLTSEELKRFSSQTGDTEGLVNYGLSIKGVRLAAIISDRKENIKLSFRSLGSFSVNDFARAHFEGGGHRNAAGGQTTLSLDETVEKFLSLLPKYKEALMRED